MNNNNYASNPESCQRSELRLGKELAIFVETWSAPDGETEKANIVVSKTIDVSANGLQIVMDKPLVPGSILQVCIEFIGQPPRYHLSGEVKWVANAGREKDYLVGFQLLDSEFTDIEAWKQCIALMLEDPANPVR